MTDSESAASMGEQLDEFIDALVEEYDLERSEEAEEVGRMVANLPD